MKEVRRVVQPTYFKAFKCIGTKCEDSCCIGWSISLDKETFKKYKNSANVKLKELFHKGITRNRTNNASNEDYAKIKLNNKGGCPFLNSEKLCNIYSELGEKYLSNVCTTYPRIVHIINGRFEKSAVTSCPEITRLALLNESGIEFEEVDENLNNVNMILLNLSTNDIKFRNKPHKYILEIRMFSIQIIKSRDYELWERLIILGLFSKAVQDATERNEVDSIPGIIEKYTDMVVNGVFKDNLKDVPSQSVIQMEILKELAEEKILIGAYSKRYLECFSDFLQGIKYDGEMSINELADNYNKAYADYYSKFMSKYDYILENFLVNQIFTRLFPFIDGNNIYDSYVLLTIEYSLVKMHLIGMAGFYKEAFDIDKVLKLIQSFNKVVDHSHDYLRHIMKLMKDNEYTSVAYMAILVKN
ncbi:flagellin lysine-N-methylase [Clostridium estertheticum]|uniref:Flagellin lysine-N-methylase n=1 Tax=Clostridium estertheticum TaxID=238834 RepID=A0AA47EJ48_9CLOT|nr:flagellin lysine-N-methylase [Clostridium estertheticum]MBU3155070.1 flagellin lysine-N-methylase [Clostridium estertheticum]WAG61126.1 flagellin lysine-N-methylase [Clostridium estertheticum]